MTKEFEDITNAVNPTLQLSFDVRAQRVSQDIPVQQLLTAQIPHTVLFSTDATLVADTLYGIGPFVNTGLHPPKADAPTTYTLRLQLRNTVNDVEDVQVQAELPVNVTWMEQTAPDTERVVYNPVSRMILWDVGTLDESTGYDTLSREVFVQVSLLPSITQIGGLPTLLEGLKLTGVDDFTADVIELEHRDLTTRLINDPYFPKDSGRVRE
jgi:hypothetical protein